MSDEQKEIHLPDHSDGSRWTPKKVVVALLLGLLVPVVLIALLGQLLIRTDNAGGPDDAANRPEAVAARIKPFGDVDVNDPSAPKAVRSGEQIFQAVCTACHTPGALGAPKLGDKAAWAPRLAGGYAALVDHAVKGFNGKMPPKGGAADLSDDEVARAVVYMANAAGAGFKEPAAKAPASTAKAPGSANVPAATGTKAPAAGLKPDGHKVFEGTCTACHTPGAAGAPKIGDKAAWAPRLAKGKSALYEHALKGFNVMPAKGGNAALSDAEVQAAVDYMAAKAQ